MPQQLLDSPAEHSRWRFALLALAMTNLAELAGALRPHYWSQVGTTGLNGSIEHGKLRVSSVDALAPASVASIQAGDLVSWEAPLMGFAPAALNFSRAIDKSLPVTLLVERRDAPAWRVSTNALAPVSDAVFVDFAFQIGGDLVFALVGALMIFRRSGDKSVCALGIAMICWSSNVPNVSASPLFDVCTLFSWCGGTSTPAKHGRWQSLPDVRLHCGGAGRRRCRCARRDPHPTKVGPVDLCRQSPAFPDSDFGAHSGTRRWLRLRHL